MAKLFHAYTRGIVGLPTVFLALGWVAIWLLWPAMGQHVADRRRAATKIHHSPVVGTFADKGMQSYKSWDFPKSEKYLDEATESPIARFRERELSPKYLTRSGLEGLTGDGPLGATRARAARSLQTFVPHWHDPRVFAPRKTSNPTLSFRLSKGLEDVQLKLRNVSIPEKNLIKRPWRVVVRVESGTDGRVAHVFVEQSSGSTAIDMAVVREMHKGTISERGVIRAGSVVVNFGTE